MTIENLIKTLEELRDAYGPNIKVMKRRVDIASGTIKYMHVNHVLIDDSDEDPANWTVNL